jgi:hypothetical protein
MNALTRILLGALCSLCLASCSLFVSDDTPDTTVVAPDSPDTTIITPPADSPDVVVTP